MNLSLNLRLCNALKLSSGLQVLQPAFISTTIDTPQTITLNASNTTSYAVTNLPTWCTLNSSTGEIICTPDGTLYGHEKFDVILTNSEGNTTITDGLQISLYRDNLDIPKLINDSIVTVPQEKSLGLKSASIAGTRAFVPNPDGLTYTSILKPYEAYGQGNQLIAVDLNTGLTVSNIVDNATISGDIINSSANCPMLNNTILDVWLGGGSSTQNWYRANTYNTNDHTWNFDAVLLDQRIRGEVGSCITTTDQTMLVAGVNYDTNTVIVQEIGQDLVPIKVHTGIQITAQPSNGMFMSSYIAGDDTHIYVSLGKQPYEVIAVNRSDSSMTLIDTSATDLINIQQREFGCFMHGSDGLKYYLYNGAKILAGSGTYAELDDPLNIPWADKSPVTPESSSIPLPPNRVIDRDTLGVIPPDGSTTGKVYHKLKDTPTSWDSATVSNVRSYDREMLTVVDIEDGRLVFGGQAYSGYAVFDIATRDTNAYNLLEGRSSIYSTSYNPINKTYLTSGYPSGTAIKWDTTKIWDNTIDLNYNPDVNVYTQPEFIGYMDEFGGHHQNNAIVHAPSGRTYFGGIWRRDGSGGGITVADTTTNVQLSGYRTGLELYYVKDMTLLGTNIVVHGNNDGGTENGVLYIIDDNNDTISAPVHIPNTFSGGQSITIDGDTEHIYMISDYTSATDTTITKLAIPSMTIVWQTFIDVIRHSPLAHSKTDSYLYFTTSLQGVIRVDTSNGLSDLSFKLNANSASFIEREGIMYLSGTTGVRDTTAFLINKGFIDMPFVSAPNAIPYNNGTPNYGANTGTEIQLSADTDWSYKELTLNSVGTDAERPSYYTQPNEIHASALGAVVGDAITWKVTVEAIVGDVHIIRSKFNNYVYADWDVLEGNTTTFTVTGVYALNEVHVLYYNGIAMNRPDHNWKVNTEMLLDKLA